jgi:broad specificity phosphatase PhoE
MWLTLVRHAEPAYVVDGISWSDPPLTDRGREQADLLAKRASQWEIDAIWVSTMVRARQTAEPLAESAGVEPRVMEWLGEIRNPPGWDGSPADEIEEFFATSSNRSVEEMWEGAPGGESFRDFHTRIHGGLEATFAEAGISRAGGLHLWDGVDDRRIVVVAHGGTNALILGLLLGVDPTPWEWDRFTHVHSGVSRLISQPTAGSFSWSLRALSDRSHLPADMVTA